MPCLQIEQLLLSISDFLAPQNLLNISNFHSFCTEILVSVAISGSESKFSSDI